MGMKLNIAKVSLSVLILFSMAGCSGKTFELLPDKDVLLLDINEHRVDITDTAHHFGHPVDVKRYVIMTDLSDHHVVYEYAFAALGYEFSKSMTYTLKAVFDATAVKTLDFRSNVHLIEVRLKDDSTLYSAAIEDVASSYIKIIYSPSRAVITSIYNETVAIDDARLSRGLPAENGQSSIKTHWDYQTLFIKKIVTPVHISPVY